MSQTYREFYDLADSQSRERQEREEIENGFDYYLSNNIDYNSFDDKKHVQQMTVVVSKFIDIQSSYINKSLKTYTTTSTFEGLSIDLSEKINTIKPGDHLDILPGTVVFVGDIVRDIKEYKLQRPSMLRVEVENDDLICPCVELSVNNNSVMSATNLKYLVIYE